MNRTLVSGIVVAGFLLAAGTVHAGAWTQAEGNYYAKFWARTMSGTAGFFPDGEVLELDTRFTDLSANIYAEYGITDGVTVSANSTPYGFAKVGDKSKGYLGEQAIGVRYGILRGAVPVAVEGRYGYSAGVGRGVVGSGIAKGQPWFYAPTISTQTIDLSLQAGFGGSFGWINLGVGGKYYTHNHLDEALYASLATGTSFGPVSLGLSFFYHEPFGDIEVNNIAGTAQTRYLGNALSATWWLSETMGVGLGAEGAIYAAANAAAPVFTLNFEMKSQ